MSKVELMGLLPRQPIPTPEQLENSIKAIKASHSGDGRVERYQSLIPEAQMRETEWKIQVKRIKGILKI